MTKERLRKLVGNNIRSERVARNMSIDELAEQLALTPGFVGLIERGRRGATAYTLMRLSDVFGVTADVFFLAPEKKSLHPEEDPSVANQALRAKAAGLMKDLTDAELNFVVRVIKSLKQMNRNLTTRDEEADE